MKNEIIKSSHAVQDFFGRTLFDFAQDGGQLDRMACQETERTCSNVQAELADLNLRRCITENEVLQSKVVPTSLDEMERSIRYLGVLTQTKNFIVSEILGEVPTDAIAKYAVSCPHCSSSYEWEVWLNGGLQVFNHCDQVISMLVPTAEGRVASPASLVKAWWPDGVPAPCGSPEAKCLAAWSLVSQHMDYSFVHLQREKSNECWLSASETWHRGVGDWVDHSILLASMLLHLVIKAWVVWGMVNEGGHAWVEVEIDESLRLIEATRKNPPPDRLPSVKESAAVYGVSFYRADTDFPARKTGVNCSYFTAGHWWEVSLGEAVSI